MQAVECIGQDTAQYNVSDESSRLQNVSDESSDKWSPDRTEFDLVMQFHDSLQSCRRRFLKSWLALQYLEIELLPCDHNLFLLAVDLPDE
ncbi:hypothetical protein C4D60_Mb11t15600 [Musa balbisiana]|uniref:Uncharacterized protein n=1 Tax=Musa balbisiana TaxID=52838 RepID=A0A4S8J4B9_MUSBA|nr:hypothetical protein C4D60_Mb11t15600 [Musa balbisiana]